MCSGAGSCESAGRRNQPHCAPTSCAWGAASCPITDQQNLTFIPSHKFKSPLPAACSMHAPSLSVQETICKFLHILLLFNVALLNTCRLEPRAFQISCTKNIFYINKNFTFSFEMLMGLTYWSLACRVIFLLTICWLWSFSRRVLSVPLGNRLSSFTKANRPSFYSQTRDKILQTAKALTTQQQAKN